MHSYGGLVGSEATVEDLGWAKRKEQGLAGGVIHFIFFSAFLLSKGQSVLGAFGESPNNIIKPGVDTPSEMRRKHSTTIFPPTRPSIGSRGLSTRLIMSRLQSFPGRRIDTYRLHTLFVKMIKRRHGNINKCLGSLPRPK